MYDFRPFSNVSSGLDAATVQGMIDAELALIGDQLWSKTDLFSNIPAADSDGHPATQGDKVYVEQDTVGSGTVNAPEYPKGIYQYNETSAEWEFHFAIGSNGKLLTPVFLNLTAGQNYQMLPNHWYGIQSAADASATLEVPLMAQDDCIEINSAATENVTLTYASGVTTHGTPSTTIKPTYYASIIARNANLVEVVGLEESQGSNAIDPANAITNGDGNTEIAIPAGSTVISAYVRNTTTGEKLPDGTYLLIFDYANNRVYVDNNGETIDAAEEIVVVTT